MSGASRHVVVLAAAAMALFTVTWRLLTFSGFSNDHYVHLARAQQMLLGDWPIRDFVDPGLPLMYAASAAARLVGGRALGIELSLVAGALALAAALTVVAAARLSGSVLIASAVSWLGVVINPRSYSYPKRGLYAVLAALLCRFARDLSKPRVLALAVLTVVAFLFRHDHGVFIGIGAVTFILAHGAPAGWRVTSVRIGLFAAATALLLLPWAVYVSAYFGLVPYFASALQFAEEEGRANVLRALPRIEWSHGLATAPNSVAWLFYLFHTLPLACLATMAWRRGRGPEAWPGETAVVVALAVLALPLNFSFLRDTLSARVQDAVVPAALLGAWLLGLAFRRPWTVGRATGAAAALGLLGVTAVAVLLAGGIRDQLDRSHLTSGTRALGERIADLRRRLATAVPEGDQVPSRQAAGLMPFMAFLQRCTAASDRVLVTSLRPEIYVIADRGFAGGHTSYAPSFYGSDADQALTITRLQRQSVPFVVRLQDVERGLVATIPRVMAYLDDHYMVLGDIEIVGGDPARLYFERGRAAARTDEATGWPCPGAN